MSDRIQKILEKQKQREAALKYRNHILKFFVFPKLLNFIYERKKEDDRMKIEEEERRKRQSIATQQLKEIKINNSSVSNLFFLKTFSRHD